jgi:hypothetical protein
VNEIFLDTSIMIARIVHGPETKSRIKEQLSQHDFSVTSLVVKQEFKRRLLKEAQYLLRQLSDKGSYAKVRRHIIDVLPEQQKRKRNICLQMLETLYTNADDAELTERAKRTLRQLIRVGLTDFENSVNSLVLLSNCACSIHPIIEKVPYKRYEFGTDECSKTKGTCGIVDFLKTRTNELRQVLEKLKSLEKKSLELQNAENFIEKILEDPSQAEQMDPCLKVGDLIIAIESVGIATFYTLNSKESQHLCRALNQNLIVRRKNPEHEDIICLNDAESWDEF